ncbi:DUF2442 domain-containing protein [Algoriphagus sp. AK58]|uniref:DUF2442 domain-containing protein n=1 Tax=Algoriphagus sp. AK58 TaxID=1406877 RepID=UPI00164FBBDA|nr:DUF2442 domain-containing protein [Algoriphagus sp. AK58]MBC6365463.1 DUF2442 domain-containing protein [Algoriphagus sp. AK58]
MKFNIESPVADYPILEVIQAKHIADYVLEITFNDGISNRIDFRDFLSGSSHPEIRKYLDQSLFLTFEVKDGNVIWNDHDLIFPLADLYSGKIS